VQVRNFLACPASDTHPTDIVGSSGQPVACSRDWSASAFAPGNEVYCTGEVLSGTGRQIELTLTHSGAVLLATPPTQIDRFDWYFYLHFAWNPSVPSGDYVCHVKVDGQVVAERPFSVTG
jgi:hypothetical protein